MSSLLSLVLAAPVVGLGTGSGVVLERGLVITTHQVAFATARPEAVLEDGGITALAGQVLDDADRDITLLVIEADLPNSVLGRGALDAGTALLAVTAQGTYGAVLTGPAEVSVPDAGNLAGGALVDANGTVWGMLRDEHRVVSSQQIFDVLESLKAPTTRASDGRLRNLGISAAFFLGLAVWWVYRSRARRY